MNFFPFIFLCYRAALLSQKWPFQHRKLSLAYVTIQNHLSWFFKFQKIKQILLVDSALCNSTISGILSILLIIMGFNFVMRNWQPARKKIFTMSFLVVIRFGSHQSAVETREHLLISLLCKLNLWIHEYEIGTLCIIICTSCAIKH